MAQGRIVRSIAPAAAQAATHNTPTKTCLIVDPRWLAVSNLSSSASCSLSLIFCHSSNAGNDGVG